MANLGKRPLKRWALPRRRRVLLLWHCQYDVSWQI